MNKQNSEPRVLLVDDYPDAREMYGEYLEFSGFDVIEAANGMEALQRAVDDEPDIILMDLSLPVMDGWEATRRLKADARTAGNPGRRADRSCAGRHFRRRQEGRVRRVRHQAVPAGRSREGNQADPRRPSSASSTGKTRRSGKHAKTVG